MKFIHALFPILTLGILVSFSSSTKASEKLKVFACSTCSSEAHMLTIARKEAPELECHWTNPPGSIPQIGDEVCYATTRVFAVANSLSRTAKKYEVTTSPNRHYGKKISIKTVSLSSKELSSLNEFYDIDGPFRRLPNLSIQIPVSDPSIFELVSFLEPSKAPLESASKVQSDPFFLKDGNKLALQCHSHPALYLTKSKEAQVFKEVTRRISTHLGHLKWHDAWENSNLTDKKSKLFNLFANFSYHERKLYLSLTFGTDSNHNNLVYEVSYHGDEPPVNGQRRLSLDFKLLPGPSWIDGQNLGSLFHEVRPHTDLRKDLVSNCLLDFLESFEVNKQTFAPGANPFTDKPITNPSGGGGFGGICTRRVVAYAGSRRQVFYFAARC